MRPALSNEKSCVWEKNRAANACAFASLIFIPEILACSTSTSRGGNTAMYPSGWGVARKRSSAACAWRHADGSVNRPLSSKECRKRPV